MRLSDWKVPFWCAIIAILVGASFSIWAQNVNGGIALSQNGGSASSIDCTANGGSNPCIFYGQVKTTFKRDPGITIPPSTGIPLTVFMKTPPFGSSCVATYFPDPNDPNGQANANWDCSPLPVSAPAASTDWAYYRQVGTSPERYYIPGLLTNATLTTAATVAANTIYAL